MHFINKYMSRDRVCNTEIHVQLNQTR